MTDEPSTDRVEIELDLPPGQEPEEGVLSKRFVNSPSRQGAEIPRGWKPTVKAPIPVVRCQYIFRDTHPKAGERCDKWSLRGSLLCHTHGGRGNLKNVNNYREALIEAARLRLTESIPDALDTVLDLMANSGADNVRLKAAESIMDRGGLDAIRQLDVNLQVTDGSPADALQDRLAKLRVAAEQVEDLQRRKREEAEADRRGLPAPLPVLDTAAEVIEGEVVEDEGPLG